MSSEYPNEWEKVCEGFYRIKVPGGWVTSLSPGNENRVWVTDSEHKWKIKNEFKTSTQ